jgi:NADP-dependent alcohol dehydrogenase
MRHQRARKRDKLLQFAARVWGLQDGDEDARIDGAIQRTEAFFRALGVSTALSDHDVPPEAARLVAQRLAARDMRLGEHADLGPAQVEEILRL